MITRLAICETREESVLGHDPTAGAVIMLYQVEAVEARPHYRLWVRFADGVEGEVDLSPLVGRGVFASWNDPGEFEKVYVDPESFTAAWPGGIDVAADTLYREITGMPTP